MTRPSGGSSARAVRAEAARRARLIRAERPGPAGWTARAGGGQQGVLPATEYAGSSMQVCGLWPFAAGAVTPLVGAPLGTHLFTGAVVCGDPMTYFTRGIVQSPSAAVLGLNGLGKSSLVARIIIMSAVFGYIPLVLADTKPDYADLIAAMDGQVITLDRHTGTVNPLDEGPLAGQLHRLPEQASKEWRDEVTGRRHNILAGLVEMLRHRPLDPEELLLLGAAIGQVERRVTDRQPLISDVREVIADPPRTVMIQACADPDDRPAYARLAHNLRVGLASLGAAGPFGAMFDGPTAVPMRLDRPVCFDVSGVDESTSLIAAAVQLVCWTYGQSAVSGSKALADAGLARPRNSLMVLDELWRVLEASESMVDRIDAITRLNRTKGLGQIVITHTLNDLRMGSERATHKAWGMIERSHMKFIGAVPHGEIDNLRTVFHISDRERDLLTSWAAPGTFDPATGRKTAPGGRGKFLLKLGDEPGIPFQTHLTAAERAAHDTNIAFADRMRT